MAEVGTVRCSILPSSPATIVCHGPGIVAVSLLLSIITAISSATWVSAAPPFPVIESIKAISSRDVTRVVLTFSAPVPYRIAADPPNGSPSRLHLRFSPVRLAPGLRSSFTVDDPRLKAVRVGQLSPSTIRVTLDVKGVDRYQTTTLRYPHQVVVLLKKNTSQPPPLRQSARRPQYLSRSQVQTRKEIQQRIPPSPSVLQRHQENVQKSSPPSPPLPPPPKEGKDSPPPSLPLPEPRKQPTASRPPAPLPAPVPQTSPIVKKTEPSPFPVDLSGNEEEQQAPVPPPSPLTSPSATAEQHAALTVPPPLPAPLPGEPEIRSTDPQRYRIVLDPGHGGTDPGARGVGGLEEKAVVLAVTKKLAQKLRSRLGVEVILTRNRDIFIPLPGRTARANKADADLFVSIHANASPNPESRGIETYYLNNTNDRATIRLAKLENGIRERQQLPQREAELSYILSDLIQTGKEEESIALAEALQTSLIHHVSRKYPDVRDLGVKKGPFYVLVGAHMPCVLVELSFLTHPVEGKNLGSRAYQEVLAEGLFAGISQFFRSGLAEKNL